ncbi:sideroflexin-1-like isoform X2 [Dysidea avara]|uniref:sideroflexin-1-like isoform X2 n=1 Tax=Dysidea avara TaxID=196820 RepID=UPI0033335CB2
MVEYVGVLPWDQSTFIGRLNYYARVTDPRLVFSTNSTLNKAKNTVTTYQEGRLLAHLSKEEIIRAHVICGSAFHPDNGAKMNIPGRMCAQVPCGMLVVGGLLTFYKTMPQLIAMQFVAQSFVANMNYTNRNAKSQITKWQVATAFVGATSGATFASVLLNSLLARAPSLLKRFVPFGGMIAANSVNIPTMRQRELIDGIVVTDKDGNALGKSRIATAKGLGQVLLSRICLIGPVMLVVPTLMEVLERRPFFKRGQFFLVCTQVLLSGTLSLRYDQLETSLQQEIRKKYDHQIDRVYFNKGL